MDELTLSVVFWGGVLAALFAVLIIILVTMHIRALARIKLEEARIKSFRIDELRAELDVLRQMMHQILITLDRQGYGSAAITNSTTSGPPIGDQHNIASQ